MIGLRSVQSPLLWSIAGTLIYNVLVFVLLALLVRDPQTDAALGSAPIRVSIAPVLSELQRQPQRAAPVEAASAAQDSFRPAISPKQVAGQNSVVIPALRPTSDMQATMQNFSTLPGLQIPEFSSADLRTVPESTMAFAPQVYATAALDSPVQSLTQTPFIYPLRAKRKGIEGWVNVALQVGVEGNVEAVEVLEAKPEGVFEESVTRSIRGWRFSPATVMGERVKTRVVTTIRFELED